MDLDQALQRGAELHRAGRLAEAETLYRAVLREAPRNPDALHLLGLIARAAGRHQDAVRLIEEAIAVNPASPFPHYNLGRLHHDLGQLPQAEAAYRRALACQPSYAEALNDLAGVLQAQDRLDEAETAYRQALAVRPAYPQALSNLGTLVQQRGDRQGALDLYLQALELQPEYLQALHNLGTVLRELGRSAESIAAFERALRAAPGYVEAHCGLAQALLQDGQLARGWEEYEWRLRDPELSRFQRLPGPVWDGADPSGRAIVVCAEQGFGDTIQFCRYASLLAARGAQVTLECQPGLVRLLRSLDGVQAVIPYGQPWPPEAARVPLLSLPRLFGTTLDSIPARTPYLAPPPGLVQSWRERLPAGDTPRVGLVWAANPHNKTGRAQRSLGPEDLPPLAALGAVTFVSLQLEPPPPGLRVLDLSDQIGDFADTAAIVANLDLVITVDTAVAHLAGALGRKVWVLLPFDADWRWLAGRADSPWYPGMRLFRQATAGDWAGAVAAAAAELKALVLAR